MKQTIIDQTKLYDMIIKADGKDLETCKPLIDYMHALQNRVMEFETLVRVISHNIDSTF